MDYRCKAGIDHHQIVSKTKEFFNKNLIMYLFVG